MDFQELKQKSQLKVLLRGKSGRGKTYRASDIALRVSREGGDVLFIDTEAEGSTTLVNLVESETNDYGPEDVENIEYVQAENYDDLIEHLDPESGRHDEYDLVILDTVDHKHSYVLKHVTDAKRDSGADWQEYASIYAEEKEVMEKIGKPRTNILCTLDPESGGMDKPKGSETNVHGYFSVVVDLMKNGDEWGNKIRNWVGLERAIGVQADNLNEKIVEEVTERSEV